MGLATLFRFALRHEASVSPKRSQDVPDDPDIAFLRRASKDAAEMAKSYREDAAKKLALAKCLKECGQSDYWELSSARTKEQDAREHEQSKAAIDRIIARLLASSTTQPQEAEGE